MKSKLLSFFILLVLCFVDFKVLASTETPDTGPISPGVLTESNNQPANRILLKSSNVEADINGSIAEVHVRQQYKNSGESILSGKYTFPAPAMALVHDMKIKTGEQIFKAKVKEQKSAQEEFNRFEEQGKNAILLKQDSPDLFSMDLANIMPGETFDIEFCYTELLIPTDMKYKFVYPIVSEPKSADQPEAEFNIKVNISAGIPILNVMSTTHNIDTIFKNDSSAKVALKDAERMGDKRNFVLNYRLAGQKMPSGLILSGGEDENFLLLNDYISSPGSKNVTVKFTDLKTYDLEPSVTPAIYTGKPVTVLGKWKGEEDGFIKVKGNLNGRNYSKTYRFLKSNSRGSDGALEHLWAGKRIERLSDLNTGTGRRDIKSEITDLGLKYNILTGNTSFIALNDVVREVPAPEKEVKQALPLPEKISKPAPKRVAKVPEPGLFFLVLIMTAVLSAGYVRKKVLRFSPVENKKSDRRERCQADAG